ncbi:nitrogenase molybdenum-iron protein beta chain [Methanocella conradii HZ254]|uniref:Nitrogenase molybdenum-iron protein beta chain n=1 Tax=Methanocella conradii (strain DSM 24694 / JCM 17849 / CGMCC 1.5162 / HZ254) TaxID=1041930 RepID=H8I6M5_METCZ|nr:nitrogenase molybdenum-iron protein subunit beta [Methanocella conradii]AFC98917.1 nitrogenase molybdenum-iron protein beta chain [Methanocella conradii HZ254]
MLECIPTRKVEHTAGKINPAKACQPLGAMYAALGIHGCLPHSHGSQGCCAYHRMALTRHFRDPIMASSSSFTEGASVFGGAANLKASIKNVFKIYNPEIMAVHTTCLSETIGDDVPTIIKQSEVPEGKIVIHANTPSYVGSHVTGFSNMCKAMVSYLAESDGRAKKERVNILPGFVNPGDMREIKRLVRELGVEMTVFPDTSNVVDAPLTGRYEMYPEGGATVAEIRDSGNSKLTLALGAWSSEAAGALLQEKCGVPCVPLKIPIGLKATDEFIMALKDGFGVPVPRSLTIERGQVVDTLIDTHFHYQGKKVAVVGDPDLVIPLTEFLLTMGMVPAYVMTGTPGQRFESEIQQMLDEAGIKDGVAKAEGDLFELHKWVKDNPVDLLIGNTHCKYIARAEDVPLVRFGFPIFDRAVHYLMPVVGYRGCLRLIEQISNALLERRDRDCKDEDYELIL